MSVPTPPTNEQQQELVKVYKQFASKLLKAERDFLERALPVAKQLDDRELQELLAKIQNAQDPN